MDNREFRARVIVLTDEQREQVRQFVQTRQAGFLTLEIKFGTPYFAYIKQEAGRIYSRTEFQDGLMRNCHLEKMLFGEISQ